MITPVPSINAQWRSRLSDDARRLVRLGIVGTSVVYRMFDCGGALLYVGISRNLPSRLRADAETQAWWHAVVRIEIEVHHDRASAERAEVVAIWTENPVHNGTRYTWQSVCLQGHPGLWPLRPGPATRSGGCGQLVSDRGPASGPRYDESGHRDGCECPAVAAAEWDTERRVV